MTPQFGKTNPSPQDEAAEGVRRFASLVELKPDKEQLYRKMHANVLPDVVAAITRAHVRNYNIFLVPLAGKKYLFRYFEYTGSDLQRDLAIISDDPTTRDEWWPVTDNCQIRIPGTPDGEQWFPAEQLMHLP